MPYTEAMPDPLRYRWRPRDFALIAEAQAAFEDDAARWTASPLICDTNPYVTALFHHAYLGTPRPGARAACASAPLPRLRAHGRRHPVRAGRTTGLRQDGALRAAMHDACRDYARSTGAPLIEVSGSPAERLSQATQFVDRVIGRAGRP